MARLFWLCFDQLFKIHHHLVWQQGIEQFPPRWVAQQSSARNNTAALASKLTHHVSRKLFKNIWLSPS